MAATLKVHKWHAWMFALDLSMASMNLGCTCMFRSCVEWGSTNTRWHINVHHVKICTQCEVKHNGDMGMGHLWLIWVGNLWLNGWGIYDLRVWLWLKWVGQLWQSKLLFRLEICSKNAGLQGSTLSYHCMTTGFSPLALTTGYCIQSSQTIFAMLSIATTLQQPTT